jgi:protein-disulfide isomerase
MCARKARHGALILLTWGAAGEAPMTKFIFTFFAFAFCSASFAQQPSTPAAPDTAALVQAEMEKAANVAAKNRAADLLRDAKTPVMGNADGDVTVVAFTDYQCPYCKAAEPRLLQLLKDDGKVRFVIKDFPILGPASVTASKAALAAAKQGKHHEFHVALMAYKGQLQDEVIFATAKSVGLDVKRLKKDMQAPEIADQVLANMNLARALKVSVVPGYFVDTRVLSGVSSRTQTSKIDFTAEIAAARAGKE